MGDALEIVIAIAGYLYVGYCLYTLASKTGTDNAWWGFVPILQMLLLLSIADRPIWWIVLLFIPFVNIVVVAILMMGVAANRGKPAWMGLLIVVPVVNLAALGYLAFAD